MAYSSVNVNKFTQKVDKARQRAALLHADVDADLSEQSELLTVAVAELHTALEELHVAEEELRAQNEELLIARMAVEAERQRYHDLFEFAPDAYLVTTATGGIREANRAAADLFKVSQRYLVGKPLTIFVEEEERRDFRSQLTQLECGAVERVQEWEISLRSRAQESFDAALTVAAVRDDQGSLTALRWIIRDITARKQAEEKLHQIALQNSQLQESARMKSHFLAIMSHELRSPMNAIIGFSQLLLRHPHDQLPPKQENMVERILNSGKHLLKLIDDILDFSKIEADRLELQIKQFNLVDLVKATVEEMRSLAEQKNLDLHVTVNINNPNVANDITRLRQILVNLISNALKFTDAGRIEIEVSEAPGDSIAIAIKDTGIGIAEDDVKHIFEEFRQLNQTITRQHGGTGLGLAICDRLVRQMGGTISLQSQLDLGSTFSVKLPRQVTHKKPQE